MGSQLAKDQDQLKNLNFTEEELQKLYKNFSKLDKDKNGTLEPEEFFDIPGKSFSLNQLIRVSLFRTCKQPAC